MGFWDDNSSKQNASCPPEKPLTQAQKDQIDDSLTDVARTSKTPAKPLTQAEREARDEAITDVARTSKTPAKPLTEAQKEDQQRSLEDVYRAPECKKLTPDRAKEMLKDVSLSGKATLSDAHVSVKNHQFTPPAIGVDRPNAQVTALF